MNVEERFKLVYPRIQKIARSYSNKYPIPYEEYESTLCEEFINVDASFDPKLNDSYSSYVARRLDLKALRLSDAGRKERIFYDNTSPLETPSEDEEGATYPRELIADTDVEAEVFDGIFVESTLERYEGETRDILQAFFDDPHASFREIGRRLGLNDKLVKRRLEKVAKEVANDAK